MIRCHVAESEWSRLGRARTMALSLAIAAIAWGCAPHAGAGLVGGVHYAEAGLPEDSVPIGANLYMVPQGRDADGCVVYRVHAPQGEVLPIDHYRTASGSFTAERADALCQETDEG